MKKNPHQRICSKRKLRKKLRKKRKKPFQSFDEYLHIQFIFNNVSLFPRIYCYSPQTRLGVVVVKGQKISERNCDVLNVSKKQRNCFYLLDKLKPETVGVTLSDEEDVNRKIQGWIKF